MDCNSSNLPYTCTWNEGKKCKGIDGNGGTCELNPNQTGCKVSTGTCKFVTGICEQGGCMGPKKGLGVLKHKVALGTMQVINATLKVLEKISNNQ